MANSCEHPTDKIDVGGYCNALVLDEGGYGDVCGVRVFPHQYQSPLPGQVYAFVDFNAKPPLDENGNPVKYVMPDIEVPLEEANLITSRVEGDPDTHKLILDIDFPVKVIPSSTPGHFHLYLDKEIDTFALENILYVLASARIIEPGYAQSSMQRGYTAVRLPWIKKEPTNGEA